MKLSNASFSREAVLNQQQKWQPVPGNPLYLEAVKSTLTDKQLSNDKKDDLNNWLIDFWMF